MNTVRDNHKKFTTKSFNRRISALLAFILLFQTVVGTILTNGALLQVKAVEMAMGAYKEISEYYSNTAIGKCQKIEKTGEAFGGLCLLLIDIGTAVKDITPADIKLMAEALETGSKTALAMAAGDARAMGQSLKYLLAKESIEAFADND